jgi:hypothetical protein
MPLPVASAIPGKARNSKRPSHSMRSSLQLGPSCIFRRTAQPSVMCGALSRVRRRSRIAGVVAKRSAHADVRGAQMMKDCAARWTTWKRRSLILSDKRRSSLTTIIFAFVTASTLLTKSNSLPMPRFRQTCGRKYGAPCGGRSAKRGLLNNSQIMIRSMAQRNPSQMRQPGISKRRH